MCRSQFRVELFGCSKINRKQKKKTTKKEDVKDKK